MGNTQHQTVNEHGLTFRTWRGKVDLIFSAAIGIDTRCLPECPEVDLRGEWEDGVHPCDTAREAAFFLTEDSPDAQPLMNLVMAEADRVDPR